MDAVQRGYTLGPTRREAEAALAVLREWMGDRTNGGIEEIDYRISRFLALRNDRYPAFVTEYPRGFVADAAYLGTLPDLQNGPAALIRGLPRRIEQVGISNFRLPMRVPLKAGGARGVDVSVSGTVSLEADKKGINMSRIIRLFYEASEGVLDAALLEKVVAIYKARVGAADARVLARYSMPLEVESLRSGLTGWQYYDVTLEAAETAGEPVSVLHLDYVYSSTCPCSLELSEHARRERGQLATPHAQRSLARLSMVLAPGAEPLWVEDAVALARTALPTETQVMVKREDEQAFAELNGANPVFVEDAARLFAEVLRAEPRVGDFRVALSHHESLHSHDAVAVLTEGRHFACAGQEPRLFGTLAGRG